jgi:hypothetical protein
MDNDDYGFCYHLEKDFAKNFDKANLAAFVTQVRARFDTTANAVRKTDGTHKDRPGLGGSDSENGTPCNYAELGISFKGEEAARPCWTCLARKPEQATGLATR